MNLRNFLLKTVISPHGVTDLQHSLIYGYTEDLLRIQVVSLGFSEITANLIHTPIILDAAFVAASCIHFRNDFTFISDKLNTKNIRISPVFLSTIFSMGCIAIDEVLPYAIGMEILVLFMGLIHVPNHYRKNAVHLSKDPILAFMLIMFTTALINGITEVDPSVMINFQALTVAKSIVVSHVVYSETYVDREE